MTNSSHEMPGQDDFDKWHREYREKAKLIEGAIADAVFDSLHLGDMHKAANYLRRSRESFEHRFCLLLYGSGTDPELASELRDKMVKPISNEEFQTGLAAVAGRSNSTPMTLLMIFLHEQAGMHLVMLERESESLPDGPIRIRAPDPIWFDSFKLLAELAQAIIVVANIGQNLLREIYYLKDAGLASRVLALADYKVFLYEEGTAWEELKSWQIWDGLGEAVEYAASQPLELPN